MTDWDAAWHRAQMLLRQPEALRYLDQLVRGPQPACGPEPAVMHLLLHLRLVQVNPDDPALVQTTRNGESLIALLTEEPPSHVRPCHLRPAGLGGRRRHRRPR
ncbi:MAG: hypothetical protein ACRDT2_02595 [Natronosporangium sp.]